MRWCASLKTVSSLVFLLLLKLIHAAEYDFTAEIPAGKLNCFFQPVTDPRHVSMDIDYQVIDGGDLDINFYLSDPSGSVLAQDVRKMDSTHKVDITRAKGDYQLCFDNTFSYQAAKIVFFEIILYDSSGSSDEGFGTAGDASLAGVDLDVKAEEIGATMDKFKGTSQSIKTNLNRAEHFQALLKAFDARDRAVMEANFERVNFWSIFNGIVMVLVGLLQVYMIRSLFDDNSKIGKIIRK